MTASESGQSARMALPTTGRSRGPSRVRLKEALEGYMYISPWVLGFLLFTIGPLFVSLYYSLNRYTLLMKPEWFGLGNYRTALFSDGLFWKSVDRTLLWTITTVPLGIVGSFLAALLLNRKVRGTTAWRIMFFVPSLTPQVAAAMLWIWILQPDVGVVNSILKMVVGIRGPGWLSSAQWAFPSLVLIALWTGVGSSRMLIFLAGLQGVPRELYDASVVDGANGWQKVMHVTIPMISSTIFLNTILGVIGSFQVFGTAFVTTGGGPVYTTYFYALHLYQTAFRSFDFGYGSALAWFLFIAVLLITALQIRVSGSWVYYAGEVRK